MKGVTLAEKLGGHVTPGMVSDLANSKRALNAKWLRRIAPHLNTTPGMLLDYDPYELSEEMIERWVSASTEQKAQLVAIAATIVPDKKTGTND
jgi:hypothetical protein